MRLTITAAALSLDGLIVANLFPADSRPESHMRDAIHRVTTTHPTELLSMYSTFGLMSSIAVATKSCAA